MDAGVARADARQAVVLTPECLEIAIHIAGVIIKSAGPSQQAIFEAERDRIVRATGEVCTTQQWSKAAIGCFRGATTQVALKECEAKFPTQPQPPPGRVPAQPDVKGAPAQPANPDAPGGHRREPAVGGAQVAPPRAGSATTPRAGAGSAAVPRAGAGSAAVPRPAGGGLMPPRAGTGSAR